MSPSSATRTKPDRADENQALIENVFAELEATRPEGLRYAQPAVRRWRELRPRRLDRNDDGTNPSDGDARLRRVRADIGDRCDEAPAGSDATVVGTYGFPTTGRLMTGTDGTADTPWVLQTPSGGSEYTAYRDDASDPPALVVQVGKTQLRYDLRCIDDLHAMLVAHGDWVPLGSADEQKPAADGTVEAWARADRQPGRRLVRAEEGAAWTFRQLRSTGDGALGPGRGRTQPRGTTGMRAGVSRWRRRGGR